MSLRSIALPAALAVCFSAFALAQYYPQPNQTVDMQSGAYRLGLHEGSTDRGENRAPMYHNHPFQSAQDQQAYQAGYAAGYENNPAASSNGGYPQGAYGYPQTAYPPGYGYPQAQSADDQGFQRGLQDGLNDGARDAQTGHGFRATNTERYEDADAGYKRSFGDKNHYKQAYRQGYTRGYQQGFSGYANNGPGYGPPSPYPNPNAPVSAPAAPYPGAPVYGQPAYPGGYDINSQAYRSGYQQGVNDGVGDAQTGHSFRATRTERYEDADTGYNSSLGDKNQYKQFFRQGYVAGYQQGYNGGR